MNQIGGSIPNFISERQMPKQLAEKVPQVLEYMSARREGQSGRKPKLVSRSAPSTPAASTTDGIQPDSVPGPSSASQP